MAKYLIQDIVPPDRKRLKVDIRPAHHAEHHEDDREHPAHHAETRLKHPHHEAHATRLPQHGASHGEHASRHASPSTHHKKTEDPREMILENLYERDVKNPVDHESVYRSDETIATDQPPPRTPAEGRRIPAQFPVDPAYDHESRREWGGWIPWLLIPAALAIVVVLVLNFFAGATISVIPKHENIPIANSQTLTAKSKPAENELGFTVMKIPMDESREVPATGSKTLTSKATGKINIYNEQTVAQRLIKNTRFLSTAGKIYRINDSVTVPKAATVKGKLTPGTLEVTIYADEAGPAYNSEATDFTVPGLKGLPQATKVYARSRGAITGGQAGTIKTVSDQDMRQASDDLRVSLETKLRSKARGDLAPSQIAYDRGIIIALEPVVLSNDKPTGDDKAVVKETGTLYMVVFDREALTQAIVRSLVQTYNGEQVDLKDLDALEFGMQNIKGDELYKAGQSGQLNFTLDGNVDITWIVDQDELKKELAGIPKNSFDATMEKYPTVDRAKANLHPRWKSSFPADTEDIEIEIVSEIAS